MGGYAPAASSQACMRCCTCGSAGSPSRSGETPGWADKKMSRFHCQMQSEADGIPDVMLPPAPRNNICRQGLVTTIERIRASNVKSNETEGTDIALNLVSCSYLN